MNLHNQYGGSKGFAEIMSWGSDGYRVTWDVDAGKFSVVHPDLSDALALYAEIVEEIR